MKFNEDFPSGIKNPGVSEDGESIVLKKFHGDLTPFIKSTSPLPEKIVNILGVDVETTGKEAKTDKITELTIYPAKVDALSGRLLSVEKPLTWLNDPGMPIPKEISQYTGITDEMVKGKSIDKDMVLSVVKNQDYIIAHEAKFDHGFVSRIIPQTKNMIWADSRSLPWRMMGASSTSLASLSNDHGFFYDAHRSELDVAAMLRILSQGPEGLSGKSGYFNYLFDEASKNQTVLVALGAPFDRKDELKSRNWHWDGDVKVWNFSSRNQDDINKEVMWYKEKKISPFLPFKAFGPEFIYDEEFKKTSLENVRNWDRL